MPESNIRDRLRRVTSGQNPIVKEVRRAFARGECTQDGYCAIESVRLIEEAIRSGLKFRAVLFSESAGQRVERLLPQLSSHVETILLPEDIFASAVATETPQGVAALVKFKEHDLDTALHAAHPLVVVVAGIQDPGNLGTIIRSAEAFGANAVLLGEQTVSPFNSKVVRASAGSVFRLNVVSMEVRAVIAKLRQSGVRLLATSSHKGTPLPEARLSGSLALFIGNEGAGLPRDVLKQVDETVVIPHAANVESLNAGVAASILLYEAARQRSK